LAICAEKARFSLKAEPGDLPASKQDSIDEGKVYSRGSAIDFFIAPNKKASILKEEEQWK
jgi:hypothetical protein